MVVVGDEHLTNSGGTIAHVRDAIEQHRKEVFPEAYFHSLDVKLQAELTTALRTWTHSLKLPAPQDQLHAQRATVQSEESAVSKTAALARLTRAIERVERLTTASVAISTPKSPVQIAEAEESSSTSPGKATTHSTTAAIDTPLSVATKGMISLSRHTFTTAADLNEVVVAALSPRHSARSPARAPAQRWTEAAKSGRWKGAPKASSPPPDELPHESSVFSNEDLTSLLLAREAFLKISNRQLPPDLQQRITLYKQQSSLKQIESLKQSSLFASHNSSGAESSLSQIDEDGDRSDDGTEQSVAATPPKGSPRASASMASTSISRFSRSLGLVGRIVGRTRSTTTSSSNSAAPGHDAVELVV